MRLTRLGVSLLATSGLLLLAGVALRLGMLIGFALGAVLLVLFAATIVAESPAINVSRSVTAHEVERSAPARVTLGFRALRRRQRAFTVIETVGGEPRVATMPVIDPGHAAQLTYDLDTSRRGTVAAGPVLLRRSDPFGLVVADRRVSGVASVFVRPRRHHIRMLPTGRQRDLEGPTREVSAGSAAFHQLREYVPGDDLRHIHWRTSAKTGTLVVKQLVDTTKPEVVVIVDNRAAVIGEDDFEEVVEIAASVLHAADQDGFPSQLIFADGDNDTGAEGVMLAHLDRLTDVRLSSNDSLFELADALRARGRSLVFVTGELPAPDLTLAGRIARGFSPAFLVSVAAQRRAPFVAPPGVTGIAVRTAAEFAAHWSSLR